MMKNKEDARTHLVLFFFHFCFVALLIPTVSVSFNPSSLATTLRIIYSLRDRTADERPVFGDRPAFFRGSCRSGIALRRGELRNVRSVSHRFPAHQVRPKGAEKHHSLSSNLPYTPHVPSREKRNKENRVDPSTDSVARP